MKNENTGRVAGETMQILEEKLEQYIEPWLSNTELESINGRRTEILAHCMEMGEARKGNLSPDSSNRGREDDCFSGLCIKTCSEASDGPDYLCDSLYEHN